jgi:cupin 2 domain-containing protein
LKSLNEGVIIERMVSTEHASTKEFWYDQDEAEWVVVQWGEAKPLFEGESQPVTMRRSQPIASTTPKEPTVWLAVFYGD